MIVFTIAEGIFATIGVLVVAFIAVAGLADWMGHRK
jgi:hypothetical protein